MDKPDRNAKPALENAGLIFVECLSAFKILAWVGSMAVAFVMNHILRPSEFPQ